ncbi:MAG: hypothetical protein KatS3mg010_1105 [Acidimicrobiia bacterium]|nr:MAG: hypothetical protein KatS3mg010_1105 [Acidimicrobiia bacterium]
MTDLLALTEELCAVPSVSGSERALADRVEQWLREHAPGLEVQRVRENVVARTRAAGRGGRVLLGGHLDTVPPDGNEVPRRDGDVLHGLGTADMKGGLAVLLDLAAAASASPRATRDCTFVFYEGEEVADEHNGLRHLFEGRARARARRLRSPARADRRVDGSRLPGHRPRRRDLPRRPRALGAPVDGA